MTGDKDMLVLRGFLLQGRTVAVHCLAELVALTEAQFSRPRRCVEAIEARLAEAEQDVGQPIDSGTPPT